jgi:hypothetical protein
MGLIDRYKVSTPGGWNASQAQPLEFEFSPLSLSGVRLGDPVSLLWKFGQPENESAAREGVYRFAARGFEIGTRNGKVDYFLLRWAEQGGYRGKVLFQGRDLLAQSGGIENTLIQTLGKPVLRNTDPDGTRLFYTIQGAELHVVVGLPGNLQEIKAAQQTMVA